jgi:hypothetical protein
LTLQSVSDAGETQPEWQASARGLDAAAGPPESERLVQLRTEGNHAPGVRGVDVLEELPVIPSR